MKKLFFIPVVLFILFGLFLSVNATNFEPQTGVTIHFKEKGTGNPISGVCGSFGPINYSTTGSSFNLGNVTPGEYAACGSGSGYLGTDSYTVGGVSPMHVDLYMQPSESLCTCVED